VAFIEGVSDRARPYMEMDTMQVTSSNLH